MSFVSSKGNILCRLIIIELYEIFALIIRAIKGLHCKYTWSRSHNHNKKKAQLNCAHISWEILYLCYYWMAILNTSTCTCILWKIIQVLKLQCTLNSMERSVSSHIIILQSMWLLFVWFKEIYTCIVYGINGLKLNLQFDEEQYSKFKMYICWHITEYNTTHVYFCKKLSTA